MEESDACIKRHVYQCIGGGGVVPSRVSQELSYAMCQKAYHLALEEACINYNVAVFVCQCVKKRAVATNEHVFWCIGDGGVLPHKLL